MSNRYVRLEDAQNLVCDTARNLAIHFEGSNNIDVVSALSKLSASVVLDLFYISKIIEKEEE